MFSCNIRVTAIRHLLKSFTISTCTCASDDNLFRKIRIVYGYRTRRNVSAMDLKQSFENCCVFKVIMNEGLTVKCFLSI